MENQSWRVSHFARHPLRDIPCMVGRVVLWVLQLYYQAVEQWRLVWRVLAIQLRNPHRTVKGSLTAEHVAIRTSDTAVLRQDTLVALVRHLRRQLAVKYLTVLVGRAGFEREIAVEETDTAFFYNYEQIFVPTVRDMSVNIVDAEAETLFLAKVGECSQLRTDLSPEALVRQAAAVFSGESCADGM